jgi:hypothetical protein
MDDFMARMDLRDSLALYLFFRQRESELEGASERLFSALRAYLYERLSIEEMERPEALLMRLRLERR